MYVARPRLPPLYRRRRHDEHVDTPSRPAAVTGRRPDPGLLLLLARRRFFASFFMYVQLHMYVQCSMYSHRSCHAGARPFKLEKMFNEGVLQCTAKSLKILLFI